VRVQFMRSLRHHLYVLSARTGNQLTAEIRATAGERPSGLHEFALQHKIKTILLDLKRNDAALAFGCFPIVQRHLLFVPGTGKLVSSDHDYVIGIGHVHLPVLSS
jgi:hypothetical protein